MKQPILCKCGCGKAPEPYKRTRPHLGHIKGEYPEYCNGHNRRKHSITTLGEYEVIYKPEHPKAYHGGYVLKHILIAEKALGRELPNKAQIHHIDLNKLNNKPNNLVICPDQTYHKLLHQRLNALAECGNPDWLKCTFCKEYGAPEDITISKQGAKYHKECKNKRKQEYREAKTYI